MLAGYRSQHPNTVDVIAARGRVTLLVVPPEASAQTVQAARMAAGQGGNTDDVETLLRSSSGHPAGLGHVGGEAEAAQQRWEVDGGRAFMNR
jgi:hypothetical protein